MKTKTAELNSLNHREIEAWARRSILPMRSSGSLCKFLRSKSEVDRCVRFLLHHGYLPHPCEPKNWDIAHILPEIGDGNFLDMGCWESQILKDVALKGTHGSLHGIDFQQPTQPVRGVNYQVGDMLDTNLPNGFLKYITCLSVIEHGVDFGKFARESARLLQDGGKLFVTFDYWNPRVLPSIKLYGLEWQPLDEVMVGKLVRQCAQNRLVLAQDIDWRLGEALIREGYHSPDPSASYTFGLLTLVKR